MASITGETPYPPTAFDWEREGPYPKKSEENIVSCYFRHMKDVLEEAGIEVTKENKKAIDRIIHNMMNVAYKACSPTWKGVKEHIKGDAKARDLFIQRLKKVLKSV